MSHDPLKEKVIRPISTRELERRWSATREVMSAKKIDFLLIQNNNDYLGGYVKWFTDLPAVHAYSNAVIFPLEDEMTLFSHGSSDPRAVGPAPWLLRGVKKRVCTPGLPSLNYTASFEPEKVVEELKGYKHARVCLVNEASMTAGFTTYIRNHLTGVTFADMTDEIDELKAVKSAEEVECIKQSATIHDEAMKACFEALRPGVREFELAAAGRLRCRMLGSEQQFILIGSAPAGSSFGYSNIHAMNRQIGKGDQVGILVEATDPAGYYTHLHRIACLGRIPEDLQRQFEHEKELQALNLSMLRPGVDPMEMWKANNDFLRSHGYAEETRLYAHGQGYDLVERPSFQVGETMKIREGMNIAVHPVVGTPKATAILCDNYMVTKNGISDCLHRMPKEIFVV